MNPLGKVKVVIENNRKKVKTEFVVPSRNRYCTNTRVKRYQEIGLYK